jgi:hypothetical protein
MSSKSRAKKNQFQKTIKATMEVTAQRSGQLELFNLQG